MFFATNASIVNNITENVSQATPTSTAFIEAPTCRIEPIAGIPTLNP
jgi:hypothetical protein